MTALTRPNPQRRRPAGFTLIEIAIAVVLLATAMTVTVQVLGWIASERRASERRRWAAQEAAILMERLSALPWDRITPETASKVNLTEPAREALPGAELHIAVDESAQAVTKRVFVRIRWRNRAGEWDRPVRLTSWVYREGRARR